MLLSPACLQWDHLLGNLSNAHTHTLSDPHAISATSLPSYRRFPSQIQDEFCVHGLLHSSMLLQQPTKAIRKKVCIHMKQCWFLQMPHPIMEISLGDLSHKIISIFFYRTYHGCITMAYVTPRKHCAPFEFLLFIITSDTCFCNFISSCHLWHGDRRG